MSFRLFVLTASLTAVAATAADPREPVPLPAPMAQHMLGNMRDHLAALAEIQQTLGGGDYDRAAQIAEQRLGLSSLDAHGAAHMASAMPAPMQHLGTRMHQAASRFARVAQESSVDRDAQRSVAALAEVTAQCVACHAAYRLH